MATLSVVLATHNEEKNLARCLSSVKELADEIIIVDGESTDNTITIAKKFGAKVIETNNPPNFHINKQKAIDLATKDWILQLDADEVVTNELASTLKKEIDKNDENNGYWIPRKNYFLGRFLMKGGQYPDYTLRLYRNGYGRLPQKSVHEQATVKGTVAYLKNPLLHYPYENFSLYIKKWQKYNVLLADDIKTELKNKNALFKVSLVFSYLFFKPVNWFLLTFLRNRGYVDGWQGFIFSFFSALRFPAAIIKIYEK